MTPGDQPSTDRPTAGTPTVGAGTPPVPQGPAGDLEIIAVQTPPPSQINDSLVIGLSIAAALCGLGFGLVLTFRGPLPVYGGLLALGLLLLAAAVRRYFTDRFPDVEAVEPRLQFPDVEEQDGQAEGLAELAEIQALGRRPLLKWTLIGSGGVFGLALLAPVATLGPRPGAALRTTVWRAGRRLVNQEGELLRPELIASGGVVSVWPEGAVGVERAATLLLRLSVDPEEPTNLDWVVDERLLAYSKICTHAGCPVALYREQDSALFCPCHQSTFDVVRGAVPTFGPAARALPQLPLGVDEAGYLVATGDFAEQVGPAYD